MADDGDGDGLRQQHHENYETKPSPVPAMSNSSSQSFLMNKTPPTKDMYWFAQSTELVAADETIKNGSSSKKDDSYWFAHGPQGEASVTNPTDPDSKESLLLKEREERVRLFKEQQEEERRKRQQELEQSFMVAKKYREQQESERRRKIEEARSREGERRQQVEERKRQIWEAEQERKEAILRRNLERESRIEARRNAHRNSMSFAFGSSTPRTFDLDLAALGAGRGPAQGSVLMTAISGRRSEERDFGTKRATSSCSLDRRFDGEDLMTRSMVSLSSVSRGRRRTDLTPTVTRDRSTTPVLVSRGKQSLRAVSMTRLDQLSQPRRRFLEPQQDSTMNGSPTKMPSPSMSKSMLNLADSNHRSRSPRLRSQMSTADNSMSRSMMHLPGPTPRRGHATSPRPPTSPKPTFPLQPSLRSAQSMTHLAITPRPNRTTLLRATAAAQAKDGNTASMLNLCKPEIYANGRLPLSVMKDSNSQSPSRPQSSMSRSSEISTTSSQASGVILRPKPAPRRPRPVTIAGTTVAGASNVAPVASKRPDRPTRPTEKLVPKTTRAKSVEPDQRVEEGSKMKSHPKKPIPPPKTSEILAKAKTRSVPLKDNLRKKVESAEPVKKTSSDTQVKTVPTTEPETKKLPTSEPETKEPSTSEPETKKLPTSEPETTIEPLLQPELNNKPSNESEVKSSPPEKFDVEIKQSVPCDKENEVLVKPATTDLSNSHSVLVGNDSSVNQEVDEKETEISGATPLKTRITSEEEARAALAEKRRLAREQAEREAELERQRQEELRRQEEERRRQEELEQKRLEEEQIRLGELHRKLEEEKLKKAIEEQQQREREEKERREEEARQKAEKEEQDRKAREEAEKQRIELEERLQKEEEERAERKRRVEQIMSRTRTKANQAAAQQNSSKPTTPSEESKSSPSLDSPMDENHANAAAITVDQHQFGNVPPVNHNRIEENKCTFENSVSNFATDGLIAVLQPNSDHIRENHIGLLENGQQSSVTENGHCKDEVPFEKSNMNHELNHASNWTAECIDISLVAQTNGYSSHEEMSCTTSPEEKSETFAASGVGSAGVVSQPCIVMQNEQSEFDQLIDLGQVEQSSHSHLDNYLLNSDDLNSNIISPGKPFIAFEDNISKKQETTVTDLLS